MQFTNEMITKFTRYSNEVRLISLHFFLVQKCIRDKVGNFSGPGLLLL